MAVAVAVVVIAVVVLSLLYYRSCSSSGNSVSSGSGNGRGSSLFFPSGSRVAMVASGHEKHDSRNVGRADGGKDKSRNIDITPEGRNPSTSKLGGGDLEAAADRLLL